MSNDSLEALQLSEAFCRQCKTLAAALNLACQDLDEDSESLSGLIEMYLAQSRDFLASSEGIAFSKRIDQKIALILCGETDDDY
jgi:hypothetical protein